MIFYDTETCGFHGPIILIQYAIDDGPIILHEVWTTPAYETLQLIEMMMNHEGGVCGFNLAFDHFHLCQTYTTLSLLPDKNVYPEDIIEQIVLLEPQARDGKCLKPKTACDIMLHARKGPYQSTMDRNDIRIKKVPNVLAQPLSIELEKRIKLKEIYFARKKNKYTPQWNIYDIEDEPDFKDIVLKFKPSSALKALAVDALGITEERLIRYSDVELDPKEYPEEIGYAPFALAVAPNYLKTRSWNNAWPSKIHLHINHWNANKYARQYAEDDVKYTRDLYKYFGSPEFGDDDSILACAVGASRWRGFKVDIEGLKKLRQQALIASKKAPTAPAPVRRYVFSLLDETEKIGLQSDSTGKEILKAIAEWEIPCSRCMSLSFESQSIERCGFCNKGKIPHPAAIKAQEVIDARSAQKEIEIYDKFILAGRFHASFHIIGALSSRMSGTDGLNAQGIKSTKVVRSCFPLAFDGDILSIGDFESFEVTLADAAYNDPKLREELQTGISIHAKFGTFVYRPMTYQEILDTKGTSNDKYKVSKNCLFSVLYGAEPYTLENKYQVSEENAKIGYELFLKEYPDLAKERKRIQNMFCSMHQEYAHGKVEWTEPAEYIETIFGFRRYFTLENQICKALFNLAENPPKEWLKLKVKVTRRDREQSVTGAVRSALFAAAFALQAANMRAAGNHVIQGSGAALTKKLQRRIWDLQPSGINDWQVQTFNVHDEIPACSKPDKVNKIKEVVEDFIKEERSKVPLLAMEWKTNVKSWGDK